MAFSQTDIDEMKARARDAGFGAKPIEIEAATQDAAAFVADDVERIELDGRVAVATGPLTDAERRAITVQLAGEEFDERRHNEISGTLSGRIEVTGAGAKAKERASAAIRRKSADAARMQSLLALQAQLEALELRIAQLDLEIDDILAKHLTPEELARLDGFKDPEEKAREEMRLMREKLERGEMTQAEFDAFEMRWQEREEARARHVRTRNQLGEMKGQTHEKATRTAEVAVKDNGVTAVASVTRNLNERDKVIAEKTAENQVDDGNALQKNDAADFSLFALDEDSSNSPPGNTSFANTASPDTQLRSMAPPMRPEFEKNSVQVAAVDPTHQVEPTQDREAIPTPPLGGIA